MDPAAAICVTATSPDPPEPAAIARVHAVTGTARRAVLRGALWGAALALLPAVAAAQPRVSKVAADYQDHPRGHFNCALCTQFRPPHACLIVEGEISPNGWCRFFDLGD